VVENEKKEGEYRVENFTFSAPLTPGLRDAIGAVCMHWSLLELMVERVVAFQTKQSIEVTYEKEFGQNLDALEQHLKDHPDIDPILALQWIWLIAQGRKLAKDRHRIVHGLWHVEGDEKIISFFAELKRKKRKIDPVQEVAVEGIQELKRAIFQLGQLWRQFAEASDKVRFKWNID
jgi:hypothetical protein